MKNRSIYIRLSESERAVIQAEAERDGRSMSDVIRRCVLKTLA